MYFLDDLRKQLIGFTFVQKLKTIIKLCDFHCGIYSSISHLHKKKIYGNHKKTFNLFQSKSKNIEAHILRYDNISPHPTCSKLGSSFMKSNGFIKLLWLQHFFSSTMIFSNPLKLPLSSLHSSCTFFVRINLWGDINTMIFNCMSNLVCQKNDILDWLTQ